MNNDLMGTHLNCFPGTQLIEVGELVVGKTRKERTVQQSVVVRRRMPDVTIELQT